MNQASDAIELIERAFSLARQSGKSDWWIMTIPVLKNRLLLLTNKSFKEADFGASNFRDFLRKVPDVVSVNETPVPGFVTLRSAESEHIDRPASLVRGEQVRADLWRAVLDYSSGQKYVWDISQQTARPARPDDGAPALPTISATDLDNWRVEFVALHRPTDVEVARRVEEWCKSRLPTVALPTALRPAWNKYLKRNVERRLDAWFSSNAIPTPPLIEGKQEPPPSDEQVDALREFVIACVKTMSKQELQELRISPTTAMRTLRVQKASDENER